MKKKLLLLFVCSLPMMSSFAQTGGTCGDNLTWTFDSRTGTLTIRGTGKMTDYNHYSSAPWYSSVRYYFKQIVIENGVTSIGTRAFHYCDSLMSVFIPSSVTSIGVEPFFYCFNFTSIEVETGNPAFVSENGILFNKDKTTLIYCPDKKSGSYTIPDGVLNINDYAFSWCTGLTSVTIPAGVTSIGNHAFFGCIGLSSISIGNNVTSIGQFAFGYCHGLASIFIPNSVKTIGFFAFYDARGLNSIDVASTNPFFSSMEGVLFDKGRTMLVCFPCGKSGNYTIPNGVENIGTGAFGYCHRLTSVSIPNSVINIGDDAFFCCDGLTSIIIPNGVDNIGSWTFAGCNKITTVTFSSDVKSIGDYAFYYCTNLNFITYRNPVPITINANVFEGVNQTACVLKVPTNSVRLYQQAPVWGKFTRIAEI